MKKKNWIVIALCIAIVGMGIGFAALSQNLQINATANITGEWDIRLVQARYSQSNGGILTKEPIFDGTSATFEVDLPYPGAWIELRVTAVNFGNILARLNSVTGITAANNAEPSEIQFTISGMDAPEFTTSVDINPVNRILPIGNGDSFDIRIEWVANPNGETVIPDVTSKTATFNFNYVQAT